MTDFAAVVFDYFGTLTPATPESIWTEHAAISAEPLGIPEERWFSVLRDSMPERFTGDFGSLEQTFRVLAERCGVQPSPEALTAACTARRRLQRQLFALRPDALPTLTELREQKLKIGVVSDCTVELSEAWGGLDIAGAVDAFVLSCEVRARKPDPKLFQLVTDYLGVLPERCLYVGDGGGNELDGATAAGMTAVMLAIDEPGAGVHARNWHGHRISTLSEVLEIATSGG